MAQIFLLDPASLSQVLQDALLWKSSTSSLMVSASNGAILSYAFKGPTPGIKELRTMSTTMTAAYAISSEDVLVFEAQVSRALSVIMPVGDHILLAVNGPARAASQEAGTLSEQARINGENRILEGQREEEDGDHEDEAEGGRAEEDEEAGPDQGGYEDDNQRELVRQELEEVASRLAETLRQDLAGLKWPGDI